MKIKPGSAHPSLYSRVIQPLIDRGYLTADEIDYELNDIRDPKSGRRYRYNANIEKAVERFQRDKGIGRAGGTVGTRTLRALQTDPTPLEVRTLVARNIRKHAAETSILTRPDLDQVVERIGGIRTAYPTIDSKVTVALALSGHDADSQATKFLSGASLAKDARPFWQRVPHDDALLAKERAGGDLVKEWSAVLDGEPTKPARRPDNQDKGGGGGLLDDVGSVFRGVSRAVFTGLETPYQALVGVGRNAVRGVAASAEAIETGELPELGGETITTPNRYDIGGVHALASSAPPDPFAQTTGGLALGALASGEPVDLGTGFFSGGDIAAQQAENSRRALSIAGHAATPGRLAAAFVTEPGTREYNILSGIVDATSILTADPANIALTRLSNIRRARGTIAAIPEIADDAPGIINGIRRTIHPQSAERFLTSGKGTKFVETVAGDPIPNQTDFLTLFKRTGDATLSAELVDARTAAEVMDVLRPALGISLRTPPKLPYAITKPLRHPGENWRVLGTVPRGEMDLDQIDEAVRRADNWMRNGKVDYATRNDIASRLATASGREAQYEVVTDMAKAVEGKLAQYGQSKSQARTLTKLFRERENHRAYFTDATGMDANPFVTIDGKMQNAIHPAYYIDFLSRDIPLPNVREIRNAISVFSRYGAIQTGLVAGTLGAGVGYGVYGTPEGALAGAGVGAGLAVPQTRAVVTAGGDAYMRLWKPLQLLRAAWTVRVIAEEQVRMAMAGYDSLFSHPIHFITDLVRKPNDKTDILGHTFQGQALDDMAMGRHNDYLQSQSGGFRQYIVDGKEYGRRLAGFRRYHIDEGEDFLRAWHERLSRLSTDPIVRKVADPDATLLDVQDWFYSSSLRREMMSSPESDVAQSLATRAGSDQYIANLHEDIGRQVADNPTLRKALATGKLDIDGEEIKLVRITKGGKAVPNKDAQRYLESQWEEGATPEWTIGHEYDNTKLTQSKDYWDRSLSFLFDQLMTRPTNYLSRSPVFREAYYNRVADLAPGMTLEHRTAAAAVARENGYDDAAKRMEAISGTGPEDFVTPAEVDELAKAHGLTETKSLLYDLTERSQFFDITRILFPFGEAFREVLTRWAKITYTRPETLRKFQVGIDGARDSGFFYTDPTSGEEMFNYPGSEWATRELLGTPIPLGGSVQGLNIVSAGTPGVGPVVQLPVSWFLPDRPEFDSVRRLVSPFGDRDTDPDSPGQTFFNNLLPSWADKLWRGVVGPEADRQFANSVMAIDAYLRTTGEYPNTPAGIQRRLDDAKDQAKGFFLVRSLASAVAPSAPIPQHQVLDKDGNTLFLLRLKDEYRKHLDTANRNGRGFDEADRDFLAKYGPDIFGAMQPFTRSLVLALPVTKSQVNWERRNPDIARKYPNVYGFFAPPGKPDEPFDQAAYQRQVASGQRQGLSAETWDALADDKIATHFYYQARDMLPESPSDADREWLRDIKAQLHEEYPGFETEIGKMGRASTEEMIRDLTRAVKDPKLAKTKQAEGIATVLKARNMVAAAAKSRKIVSWQTAKSSLDDRIWLAGIYDQVRDEYPSTGPALDMVFRNDIRNLSE